MCVSSADLISLHLDALFCGEDHFFSLACLDEACAISIGFPPHDKAILFISSPQVVTSIGYLYDY